MRELKNREEVVKTLSYFNMRMFDASRRKYASAVRYLDSVRGGVVL